MNRCKHTDCKNKIFKNSDFCILHTPKNDWFEIKQDWSKSKKDINKFWIKLFNEIKKSNSLYLNFENIHFPKIKYDDFLEIYKNYFPDKLHLFKDNTIFLPFTFYNCTFYGGIEFWEFKFKNTITIKKCDMYELCFESSTFRKNLVIEDSHIERYFNLCRVISKKKIEIHNVSLGEKCDIDFHGIFRTNVYFSNIIFNNPLDVFSHANNGYFEFNNVEFQKLFNIDCSNSTLSFNQCKFNDKTTIYTNKSNILISATDEEIKQKELRNEINHNFLIYGNVSNLEINNLDIYGQLDLKLRGAYKVLIFNTNSFNASTISLSNSSPKETLKINEFFIDNANLLSKINLLDIKVEDEFNFTYTSTDSLEISNLDLSTTEYIKINNISMLDNTKINKFNLGKTRNNNFEDIDINFVQDMKYFSEKRMNFKIADEFYNLEMLKYEPQVQTISKKIVLLSFKHLSNYGQSWSLPLIYFIFLSFIFYTIDIIGHVDKVSLSNIILYSNPLNLKGIGEEFKIHNYPMFYIYKLASFLIIYQMFIAIKRIVRRK